MPFRPLASRDVRWRPVAGDGLEQLHLAPTPEGVVARSVVVGSEGGKPFGIAYQVRCDEEWRVRYVAVRCVSGRALVLNADGAGNWTDGAGSPLPELAGAIDVDLSGSPFTNVLPIRRLNLTAAGETAELQMAYVPFDTLRPFADGQRYTCIVPGRLYRFEAIDGNFSADLPVDEDGLVTDYPTLFQRVEARQT